MQALVDKLTCTLPEMEELSKGKTRGGAQALVDALADTLAEVEPVTPGKRLSDAHAVIDLLGDAWQHTGQCPGSGQHGD